MLFKTSASGEWKKEDAVISNGVFNGFVSKYNAVEVIIPSKDVNGNGVTSIGDEAFRFCSGLTSVTIPNSVTSIRNYAFSDCNSLTSVTMPSSVTSIGDFAFYNCKGLTSVTIGNGVTSIGNNAFMSCSNLTSVTIPNSVTSIGTNAFYNTPFYNNQHDGLIVLGSIAYAIKGNYPAFMMIPSGVTRIGNYAFYGCSGLISVTIPNSVTSIGNNAFINCNNLSEMSMLGFTCDYVKANAYRWRIAVPAKQLVTIQCSDGYVILNDQS